MNENQKLCIKALEQMKGDDLSRAMLAFGLYSPKQMNSEYGQSGKTPNEILNEYREHNTKIDRAIEWVRSRE